MYLLPAPTCRNVEKVSAGTSVGPDMHQTVPSARHGRGLGRGHVRPDTRVRDTPRSAVLPGTGDVQTGQIRQRRCEACRHLPTVRRRSANMHRYFSLIQ